MKKLFKSIIRKIRIKFDKDYVRKENRRIEKLLGVKIITTNDPLHGIRETDLMSESEGIEIVEPKPIKTWISINHDYIR